MRESSRTDAIAAICAKNILDANTALNAKERIDKSIPPVRVDGYNRQIGTSDGIIRPFAFKEEDEVIARGAKTNGESVSGSIKVYCPQGSVFYNGKALECENADEEGYVHLNVPDRDNWSVYCVIKKETARANGGYSLLLQESSQVEIDGKSLVTEVISNGNGSRPIRNTIILIASGTQYGKISGRAYGDNEKAIETCTKIEKAIERIKSKRNIGVTKTVALYRERARPSQIMKEITNAAALSENVIIFIDEHGWIINNPIESKLDRFLNIDSSGIAGALSTRKDSDGEPGETLISSYLISCARAASKRIVIVTSACRGAGLGEWLSSHRKELQEMKFPSIVIHRPVEDYYHDAPQRPAGDSLYLESFLNALEDDVHNYIGIGVWNREVQIEEIENCGKKVTPYRIWKDWGYPPEYTIYYEADRSNPVLEERFLD